MTNFKIEYYIASGQINLDFISTDLGNGCALLTYSTGKKQWYKDGELHREDGPAEIDTIGNKKWYRYGLLHREDGPAIETDAYNMWYINGECHREDGPAIDWNNGIKEWLVNDKFHRIDGPAVEYPNGNKEWWVNNKRLSPEKEAILNQWLNNKNGI